MPGSFASAINQLEQFVRQSVKLNTPNAQGVTQRKTLEDARKLAVKKGKSEEELALRFKELTLVQLEPGTDYLFELFCELSSTRSYSQLGPAAISFVEIKSYSDLTNTHFDEWEVEALHRMDRGYLDEALELQSKRNQSRESSQSK